ncbi:MAG: peptidase M22 [Oscillospiraceae bacterium]|nr:peptidase M22 [Oscillospiraceae bacterium]
MSWVLGIDTSNYTTSVSAFDGENMLYRKKLLPVKPGEKGIRQSDAVFHHTLQLPELLSDLCSEISSDISAVGVSVKPSNQEVSYMPCFLTGISVAKSLSSALKIPLYEFSHQDGHIAAALYSSKKTDLIGERFLAFHISGGTSQGVLVTPNENYFSAQILCDSLDLKAGQAIDRVGIELGLKFPCGPELEKLALKSNKNFDNIKVFHRDLSFSLSGVENKCKQMLKNNESPCDIALYCIKYIESAISDTCDLLLKQYGNLPLVFSGGVMSNSIIRKNFEKKYGAYFAEPAFSSDNACGIAYLTYRMHNKQLHNGD